MSTDNDILGTRLFGLDTTEFSYQQDKDDFETADGKKIEGEELVEHLKTCNEQLADKAEQYRRKYENKECELYQVEPECEKKIKRVRHFYRDMIYLSNNRSAIMLKKATTSR